MFEPLAAQFSFPESEERVLAFWEKRDIFQKSLDIRRGAPRFVFYEGPPTANGLPHPGHCLTRAIKDLFPRYKTMCGYLVERKAGWDTHGLPVEVEVCKELGIHTKEEIETYGVEKFVQRCIESVFRYVGEWEQMTRRLGFWINLDEAYVTYHQSYVESVWWSLKTLFERGLLYQGHKVVWWWAQGGTALSAGEVGEGYRTVQDPSVYIRFPLLTEGTEARRDGGTKGQSPSGSEGPGATAASAPSGRRCPHVDLPLGAKVSLLVWTTTPWTLISNHFCAVGPDIDYALVCDKTTDEYLYIASALVQDVASKVEHDFEIAGVCKGSDLVGLRYVPPLDCYHRLLKDKTARRKDGGAEAVAWRVVPADFVALDTGTGLVHQAPAYGEVDFNLLQEERQRFADFNAIPLINAVAPDGTFTDEAPPQYRGRWVKDCDGEIIQELKDRGILYHQEMIEHEYPFCPRSEDDPLIQYARKSWFVRTSQFKEEFLKNNAGITWLPEHIREGRFGDFLRNNVDWALSRERYWGTPLPIWVCEKTGKMEAIGSYAELLAKPGVQGTEVWEQAKRENPDLPEHLKVHKPYIDAITYDSPFESGGRMRRVPEVIDCWWDAGSMPFAQWGFPHTDGSFETFAERFPCDFISEALDQTRGWFYGLLAISTLLFSRGSAGVSPADADGRSSGSAGVSPADADGRSSGSAGVSPADADGRSSGSAGVSPADADGRSSGSAGVSPASHTVAVHAGIMHDGITESLHTRRRWKIPHWEAGGSTYFMTFRVQQGELSPEERAIVLDACKHWDGTRFLLHAAVVMPDHVHLLMTPQEKTPGCWWSLAELMHSIKAFTSKKINARRGTSGPVWQAEYFDRLIRSASDFEEKWVYIVENPQRRGLGEDYAWVWVEPSHAERREMGGRDARTPQSGRDARTPPALESLQPEYPHPYKACIVLGLMMGEDGLKMSKRKKNYREPSYIFDHYGADAMRWFFFCGQTPWTSVRFQEQNIRDAQREFLVRLYNVFSFFNIYANIDGFEVGPEGTEARRHEGTGWRPATERSELDRWIVGELHRTIRFVRESMDRFENYPAAGRLSDFVDALSNWYVRRSRERFWRPLQQDARADQDKWDAYNTLYEVLVTLSRLIAPFTPFFAEVLHQNLCREPAEKRGLDVPVSVHLCDYPVAEEALIDEKLATEMELVRDIVSLGRAARTAAKLKVRQPLALAEIILARAEHAEWLGTHRDLIAEELNIKRVEFATEAEQYVTYQLKPDFKVIGPKFGPLAKSVAAALARLDANEARKELATGGRLTLEVAGQRLHLTERDVELRLEARPGWSAAQGRAGVVVVKTELSEELRDEGLCRELIHQVQGLRKAQNLPYEARIRLYLQGPAKLLEVAKRFDVTIRAECLATSIEQAAPPAGAATHAAKIEGHEVLLGIATG
jgi:isoleucyl-tRNA synthetase